MKKRGRRRSSSATALMDRVNAQMGEDVVGLASDPRFEIERVPIGSLVMERMTGGGFPRGRHVELFGDYSTGKSLILYLTLALAQQRGEVCALIDSEKVFDEAWFRLLGGMPDDLLISRPKTAEKLIKALQLFAQGTDENPAADIVGIDSVASLLPKEELEKDVEDGDDRTAGRARMMSRLLRRVTAENDRTLFIWTNQFIDQVTGYGGQNTPGGRALKFYASMRIELRQERLEKKSRKRVKKAKIVDTEVPVGRWVTVRAEKQKTSRPGATSMFYFDYDRRMIDPEYEIIHLGLEDGLVRRVGNTFSYTDSDGTEWSGIESRFRTLLRDNEEMREELVWAITENTRTMDTPDNEEE